MKKFYLLCLFLLAISPAWAIFCQYCGKQATNDAKFCPACGKPLGAVTREPVPSPQIPIPQSQVSFVPPAAVPISQTPTYSVNDSILENYSPIDKFEMFLTSSNHSSVIGVSSEYQKKAKGNLQRIEYQIPQFNPTLKKLHELYLKKFDLLEKYIELWNQSIHGPYKVQAMAQKDKLLFLLSRVDEMIMLIKDNREDPSILLRVNDMEKETEYCTREYFITSPFLMIDGHRIPKNHPIWVIEMKDNSAKVLHMSEIGHPTPISGWISIYDLENRTSWKPFASQAVYPVPPQTVVVERHPAPTGLVVIEDRWGRHYRHRRPGIVISGTFWGH
ncbi:MAG: zinc-ribbon domain-containing protein [Candidatus Riflebacteria bacterium]|nr:zinc-ribbon domain-containing protein [Candidatus Riflebacteria bacterium]